MGAKQSNSTNPYRNMFKWIRQEIRNFEAVKECIENIDKMEEKVNEKRQALQTAQREFENVNANRTTFKSVWKSISGQVETAE
jgi:hypothetical protein